MMEPPLEKDHQDYGTRLGDKALSYYTKAIRGWADALNIERIVILGHSLGK